jgi:hypothetical protein
MLRHYAAACDGLDQYPPSPELTLALAGAAEARFMRGRVQPAVDDARRGLAVARQPGYSAGEASDLLRTSPAAVVLSEPYRPFSSLPSRRLAESRRGITAHGNQGDQKG